MDIYTEQKERANTQSLPYFTIENVSKTEAQSERAIKIQSPTIHIEKNLQAEQTINTYLQRIIEDEMSIFSKRTIPGRDISSSTLFTVETLSIQFTELYIHPQLISVVYSMSKTSANNPMPVTNVRYAIFDGDTGQPYHIEKLFGLYDEYAFVSEVYKHALLLAPETTREECVRAIQDPQSIGIDKEHLHVFIHSRLSTYDILIPVEEISSRLHPNVISALNEENQKILMSSPVE